MKRLILLVSATLVSMISCSVFATSNAKASSQMQRLNAAWNRVGVAANPLQLKEDTHMVYGGQDIDRKPAEAAGLA